MAEVMWLGSYGFRLRSAPIAHAGDDRPTIPSGRGESRWRERHGSGAPRSGALIPVGDNRKRADVPYRDLRPLPAASTAAALAQTGAGSIGAAGGSLTPIPQPERPPGTPSRRTSRGMDDRVLAGSENDRDELKTALPALNGDVFQGVHVDAASLETVFEFTRSRLIAFPIYSRNQADLTLESWMLWTPDGSVVVADPDQGVALQESPR